MPSSPAAAVEAELTAAAGDVTTLVAAPGARVLTFHLVKQPPGSPIP